MTTRDSLAALASAYPDGASVPVPKSWLQQLLDGDFQQEAPDGVELDLNCGHVAALLNRSASTVRNWCAAGLIPGAYRLHGCREWRIPRSSLATFQDQERKRAVPSV